MPSAGEKDGPEWKEGDEGEPMEGEATGESCTCNGVSTSGGMRGSSIVLRSGMLLSLGGGV